jgi:hypothetical protein
MHDQDSYHQDSDDEQGAEIAHEVWSSVLGGSGHFTLSLWRWSFMMHAWELAFSAAHQAYAASSELSVLRMFK